MGGFFGAVSGRDIVWDVFFGTDYHSHLGTKSAGMAIYDRNAGFYREIHDIDDTPFRTKFEADAAHFSGFSGVGCISDSDPQPLLVRSHLGLYAIVTLGRINNTGAILDRYFTRKGRQFMAMGNGNVNASELVAAVINSADDLVSGLLKVQDMVEGTMSVLLLREGGELIAMRDRQGRLPVHIGRDEDGYAVSFESFAYEKLGYRNVRELGSGEIVSITPAGLETLSPPREGMKICAFLWTYYGYPNSCYEGKTVETMRYRNGEIMAAHEQETGGIPDADMVAGMPDSGISHAIGYAHESGKPYARPFIKYTPTWPRSFMPSEQALRSRIAKMKQIPVEELIEGKKLLFVDDSIVRGTQLTETVAFLNECGAKEVHMRSACPPIAYACKYLNFSRSNSDMDLLVRRTVQKLEGDIGQEHLDEYTDGSTERGQCLLKAICRELHFDSLAYQTLDGLLEAIGIDREKVCTYCWTGKE